MGDVAQSIEVGVTPEEFFHVIADYERYVDFVSEMRDVRVERRAGSQVEVTYGVEVAVGPARRQVRYTLLQREEPPRRLAWSLVRGELMKRNDGSWTVESLGDRRIRATYVVDVRFGLLVPSVVSDFLAQRNLPHMLGEFKARAEKLFPGA